MGFLVKIVLVLAVVAGGVWGWHVWQSSRSTAMTDNSQQVTQQPATAANTADTGTVSTGAATDASLNADLQTIDGQINSATTDSSSVDGSFNDKPVAQTE